MIKNTPYAVFYETVTERNLQTIIIRPMHINYRRLFFSLLATSSLFINAAGQDSTANYISMSIYYATQGHSLPTGTFQYNLENPNGNPTSINQNLTHRSKLLHGVYFQPQFNHKKIGKKNLPKVLELFTGVHMAYMRAQGSNARSGRMDQVEFGIREGARFYPHKNVYLGMSLLVPFGFNMLFIGDMDIAPVSFGGEVVSGPVNIRLNTTMVGTNPQFQLGYIAKNKGRNRISLELGAGYLFWHTLRNRIYMARRMNNIVNDDEQFWLRDYLFNGSLLNKKDFTRSGFQVHAGIRFMFQ